MYCRLTSTPGADITNYPKPMYILGAEQKANGAWGVSYFFDYGDGQTPHLHLVRAARWIGDRIRYWVQQRTRVSIPPPRRSTGLVWLRGAKDCSY